MGNHSMKICKKITAGLLAVSVAVSGMIVVPRTVCAEESIEDKVIYDSSYTMSEYWSTGEKRVPIKEGYVFGGWYEDEGNTPLKEAPADSSIKTYAKFVPAYVLSVKAQIESGVVENDGKPTSIRIVSSVDGNAYKNVGIEIRLNNIIEMQAPEATKVYDGIMVEGETEPRQAEDIFGTVSRYLSVWRLDKILDKNDSKLIYVRPYWTTVDGTKVEGLAKYIHVEDSYKKLVSVPVNLMTGEAVAAGALKVTCNDDRFEFYDVETGRLFTEMDHNAVDTKNVKIVGNAAEVNQQKNADGLYANIRFKLKDGADFEGGKGEFLKFTVTGESFCDWDEKTISINAWDIQY